MVNFNNETINDIDFKNIEQSLSDLRKSDKLKFTDLFKKNTRSNNIIEYEVRVDFIRNKFSFNEKKKEEDIKNNCLKGIYVLYDSDKPQYVGISRDIITRLKQHFRGKKTNEASLVYLIAREKYDKENGLYRGLIRDFPFEEYREKIQSEMRNNWEISIILENDNYLMHFKECYLACRLKTYWNTFETH